MSEHNKTLLKKIDEELQQLTIVVEAPTNNPRSGALDHKQPVASLQIPKKFFLLLDRKNCLEKLLGTSVSKHSEMANSIIEGGGMKIGNNATTAEERLKRQSARFLEMYRNPRKGGTYRKKLQEGHQNMLLLKEEVDFAESHQTAENSSAPQPLHLTGKPFEELGVRQQRRQKAKIRDALNTTCAEFNNIGLSLKSADLETTSQQKVHLQLAAEEDLENNDGHSDQIKDIAYLMLKHGVSLNFYHELCARFKDLPRAYKVQQFKKDMIMPSITRSPGEHEGSQFNFTEVLKNTLEQEIEEYPNFYERTRKFQVKISGDGARYNRNSNFCLLSFSIIRNGSVDLSSTNIHTIAAIKQGESYEALSEGFKDALDAINAHIQNPMITIKGAVYTLEFFLCADYKFLLNVMGLKNATSKHSCIWCTIDKADRYDMTITSHTSRTRAHLTGDGKLCSINVPLLDLELDHIIPDELHLMLRVMDVLIQGLIDTALAYDRHQHRMSGSRRSYKALGGPMLNNLVTAIKGCGVHFCLYEQDNGKMEWPSLLGPDKLKLLKNLTNHFNNCQPTEIASDVERLWKDFDAIYASVTSRALPPSHNLHQRAKDWVNLFLKLGGCCYGDGYLPNKVTPYMHILVYHIPSFIDKYGNVKQFSCQGVEKNNDVAKGLFFRSSNKWDATTDILANKHRLHVLKGCERTKRKYTKNDDAYWKSGGIQESRKKRPRISHGSD